MGLLFSVHFYFRRFVRVLLMIGFGLFRVLRKRGSLAKVSLAFFDIYLRLGLIFKLDYSLDVWGRLFMC